MMRPIKLFFSMLLAAALLSMGVPAGAALPPASAFVNTLGDEVLTIFKDARLSPDDQEQRIHAIAVRDFDVLYSARFALGFYWRTASDSERSDFTKAFEHYVAHVYTGQFRLHHDVDFNVMSEGSEGTGIIVRTDIIRHDGRAPIKMDWHLVKAGDTYKVADVSVNGISELVSLREQFAEIIEQSQGGVPMLTSQLIEKTRG